MADEQALDEDIKEENKAEEKIKKTRIYRTPLFSKVYATNLKTFKTNVDIRIEFFNEKAETDEEVVFYSDGLAILTMEAAKKLLIELGKLIETHESENGEIKINEERKNQIQEEE
jgi:hypothetical protein